MTQTQLKRKLTQRRVDLTLQKLQKEYEHDDYVSRGHISAAAEVENTILEIDEHIQTIKFILNDTSKFKSNVQRRTLQGAKGSSQLDELHD